MDVARIIAILVDSLGAADGEQQLLPGSELVDTYMMAFVLKTDTVHEHALEMVELLKDWPSEAWGAPIPPLGQEINYLQAGGVLGDQYYAFLFFAFGKLLGWWDLLDPYTVLGLAKDSQLGKELAGIGMISIEGYRV